MLIQSLINEATSKMLKPFQMRIDPQVFIFSNGQNVFSFQ